MCAAFVYTFQPFFSPTHSAQDISLTASGFQLVERSMHPKHTKKRSTKSQASSSKHKVNLKRSSNCLFTIIRPNNVDEEKQRFIDSKFAYNPQFEYDVVASEKKLEHFSHPSDQYLPQVNFKGWVLVSFQTFCVFLLCCLRAYLEVNSYVFLWLSFKFKLSELKVNLIFKRWSK